MVLTCIQLTPYIQQNQTQHHSEKIKDSYPCLIDNITLNLASQQLDQSKDSYLCLGTP